MTIFPAQYREDSQLRHKWVLSPSPACATCSFNPSQLTAANQAFGSVYSFPLFLFAQDVCWRGSSGSSSTLGITSRSRAAF